MKRLWSYLINTFEVNTRQSKKKMLDIANDHDARLSNYISDPIILALYTDFHAQLLLYRGLMSKRTVDTGSQKSKTQGLTELLELLRTVWIAFWEGKVRNFFPEGSATDTAIFPQKRKPFNEGSYDERINAVQALKDAMAPYSDLDNTALDVAEKYDLLDAARVEQKQKMSTLSTTADELEKRRVELAKLLYKNLGALMALHFVNPTDVERYFNLSLLRKNVNDNDSIFGKTGTVDAGFTVAIPLPKKLELNSNGTFTFTNNSGLAALDFFFSPHVSATDNLVKITALPNETVTGTVAEAAWSPEDAYLIVKNNSTLTAEFEIQLMEAVEG